MLPPTLVTWASTLFLQGGRPRLDFEEWPHRDFMSVDMQECSGKLSCRIQFLPSLKAAILVTQWQQRMPSLQRHQGRLHAFYLFLPCALSKTRCFNKEMKPKSHSIWFVGPPFPEMPGHHSKVWKTTCINQQDKECVLSLKILVINYMICRQ